MKVGRSGARNCSPAITHHIDIQSKEARHALCFDLGMHPHVQHTSNTRSQANFTELTLDNLNVRLILTMSVHMGAHAKVQPPGACKSSQRDRFISQFV